MQDLLNVNKHVHLIREGGKAIGLRTHREAEIKSVGKAEGGEDIYRFVITSNTPDRYNDVVEAQGGDFSHYMRNPVVFYNHNTHGDMLPIGKCLSFEVVENKIVADVVFDREDDYAQKIENKIKRGFLNAVSIGFIPLAGYEARPEELGISADSLRPMSNTIGVYTKWEIIEFSVVGIPANTDALLVNNSFNNNIDLDFRSEVNKMNKQSVNKALEAADVEAFIASATGEFKKVILKLLQDYNLDFSTTDVATVAGEFANGVVQAFGGVVEEPATEPAPEQMQAKEYTFKDELDFFLQLKATHKAELEMCTAAMSLPEVTEQGMEIISNLATVLPEEIEMLHEHVLTLEGKAPAESEEEEPMMDSFKTLNDWYVARAGKTISAKTRKLLQEMYEHQEKAEEMTKLAKKICRELIQVNSQPEAEASYDEAQAIEAIEDAIKNEISFI
jgi:phage head maturation protease/uncharacterized protein (DUF2267 family)